MMPERLSAADRRLLAACLLVLAVTVWFSARFFYRAFPEASIDFRVTREGARDKAQAFLASLGFHPDGYRQASRFQYDDQAKTFLEREIGLERANRLMGSRVRLWRWSQRWYRPQQKEEFRVDVTPAGDTVGFQHLIPEAAALASLSGEQARAVAEGFLANRMHRPVSTLEFVEGSSLARPSRTDHVFTWRERDFSVHDATYRIEVTVLGEQVGGYREYLKVPETWQRDYERLRSRNMTAQTIDTAVMLLLMVGMLVILVINIRNGTVAWRRATIVGVIGVALLFLSSWNSQPVAEFGYPTTDSYGSLLTRQFLQNLLSALAAGGLLFALTAGAEPVYRAAYGSRLSLGKLFTARGLRTRSFLIGSVLGLTLTGIFVAYQTGFYLVAYRFGAWSPADVPYDDLLNTRLPWLFVLFGGFFPAVSEEFIFRMFAIPFLRRISRSLWVAVIAAGFIWGFGHAGYPQQPFYIRGVEVGIGGVALGLVMLRWGILPTLVWHYSVDAMYSALLLLRSHNPYFMISGAASAGIMVLPAAIAFVLYLRRGGFEPEQGLTNRDESEPEQETAAGPPEPAAAAPGCRAWSARRRAAAAVVALAGCALLLLPVTRFGDQPRFALSPGQAHSAADRFLVQLGVDRQPYRTVIYPATRWDGAPGWSPRAAAAYFLRYRPLSWLVDAYRRDVPLNGWIVRYYKPLDPEELGVFVHPETGEVSAFRHSFAEDAAGADLPAESARFLASDFMASRGFDVDGFELKESTSEKKKARRDYVLVWEAKPGDPRNVAEARFRVRVEIDGQRLGGLSRYWKIPESFLRERAGRNALSIFLAVARIGLATGAVVLALWLLIQYTRRRELSWRAALRAAAPVALLATAGSAAQYPSLFQAYSTAIPLDAFRAAMLTSLAMGAVAMFLAACCASGILVALEPASLGVFRRPYRRAAAWDALLAAAAALGVYAAASRFAALVLERFPKAASLAAPNPSAFGSSMPAITALGSAAAQTLFTVAGLALVAWTWRRLRRRIWAAGLVAALAAAAATSSQVLTAAELISQLAIVAAAAMLWIAAWLGFGRGNLLVYPVAVWTLAVAARAAAFLTQPAVPLERQGWILVAALLLSLGWVAWPALGGARERRLAAAADRLE